MLCDEVTWCICKKSVDLGQVVQSGQSAMGRVFLLLTNFVHANSLSYNSASFNPFPHNDTFWRVQERSLLKTLWETEKLLVQAISPFPTMFSTLSNTEIIIFVRFNLSSANALNLVWSKILLFGNELRQKWDYFFPSITIVGTSYWRTMAHIMAAVYF